MIDKQAYYDFAERKLTCALLVAYANRVYVSPVYQQTTLVGKQGRWVYNVGRGATRIESAAYAPQAQCHVYDAILIGQKYVSGERWMDTARHLMIHSRHYTDCLEALNYAMLGYNWQDYFSSKNAERDAYFAIGQRLRDRFTRNFNRQWAFE